MAVLFYFLMINVLTYILYAQDKRAAREGARRVPEAMLLLLALLGGSPAALIVSKRLRHKTKKVSYRLRMVIILLAQIFTLAWWALLGGV